jgi:hypothetical protein
VKSEWPNRRSSGREPADSLRNKYNVIGGWLPSLTSFGAIAMDCSPYAMVGD